MGNLAVLDVFASFLELLNLPRVREIRDFAELVAGELIPQPVCCIPEVELVPGAMLII